MDKITECSRHYFRTVKPGELYSDGSRNTLDRDSYENISEHAFSGKAFRISGKLFGKVGLMSVDKTRST